jgi:hypothetical protein
VKCFSECALCPDSSSVLSVFRKTLHLMLYYPLASTSLANKQIPAEMTQSLVVPCFKRTPYRFLCKDGQARSKQREKANSSS